MQADSTTFEQSASSPTFAGASAVPLFHAAWLFAAGIVVSHWLWLRPSFLLIALIVLFGISAVAALRAERLAWLPVALLWALLGAVCAEFEPYPAPAPAIESLSDELLRTVEGTVVSAGSVQGEAELNLPEQGQSVEGFLGVQPSERIDLQVSSLEVVSDSEDEQQPVSGRVRLTVR